MQEGVRVSIGLLARKGGLAATLESQGSHPTLLTRIHLLGGQLAQSYTIRESGSLGRPLFGVVTSHGLLTYQLTIQVSGS